MIDFDATVLAACNAAFAEQVAWYPAELPPATVDAILFDGMKETTFKDGDEVADRVTLIGTRVAQYPRPPQQGDVFRVRGRFYVVSEAQLDGVGDAKLRLRLASDEEARRPLQAPIPA